MSNSTGVLEGFTKTPFSALGRTRDVYRMGEGPTVLVLSEIPGITPLVTSFAREVVRRGFSVAMPHLFGTDGAEPSGPRIARSIGTACVSRDLTLFATGKSSRVTRWLNELAHHEHERTGGPGVGVVALLPIAWCLARARLSEERSPAAQLRRFVALVCDDSTQPGRLATPKPPGLSR